MFAAPLILRIFVVSVLALVTTGAMDALTASNTIPASSAGEGSGVISGYTISAIADNLNGGNSSNIDSVTFTATSDGGSLAGALTTIDVEFDAGVGFYTCTRVGGVPPAHDISCDTTVGVQLTVLNTDVFHAVIVE